MAKRGPKPKENIILKNLEKIKEYKSQGVTDKQICDKLGIGLTTWHKYINSNPEIAKAIKKGTEEFVIELRGELARQAMKHSLEKKEQWIKTDKNGDKVTFTKIIIQEVDGNLGAIHLLLKNLDRDNWKNDWDNYSLKCQELELRKQALELKVF